MKASGAPRDADAPPLGGCWRIRRGCRPVFKNGGYCTSRFFNPNHEPQESDTSYVPSSVLLMEVEVY